MKVSMGNPSELVGIWIVEIMDMWTVDLELKKRPCLKICSSARKGRLREDVCMGQESNNGEN